MDKLLPPNIQFPPIPPLPKPALDLPRIEVPSYAPVVLPYSGETNIPKQTSASEEQKTAPENQKSQPAAPPPVAAITPPVTPQEPQEIEPTPSLKPELNNPPQPKETTSITLAATTSVISVVATLSATATFKHLVTVFKPIITQVLKRIQKLRGKKTLTWSRQRMELRQRKRVHKEIQGG